MQQYLNLKIDNSLCVIDKYSDSHMYILGEFFRCEVGRSSEYWIDWIENDDRRGGYGNWVWLDKIDNGYVLMGDGTMEPYDGVAELPSNALVIKQTELFQLLIIWNELCLDKWKEIMITKDGDKFEMFEVPAANKDVCI